MKRHLRRLGHAGKGQQQYRQHGYCSADAAQADKLVQLQYLLAGKHQQGDGKGQAAQQVHDYLAERVIDGFLGTGVANQGKGADRGDFPGAEQPAEIVGEDDGEHRREEEEHDCEEHRSAVLAVWGVGLWVGGQRGVGIRMLLEVFHIAEGVDADATADDANDQRHNHRQAVDVKVALCLDRMEAKLECYYDSNLGNRQNSGQRLAVFDAFGQDIDADNHIDAEQDVADGRGADGRGDSRASTRSARAARTVAKQRAFPGAVAEIAHGQPDTAQHNQDSRHHNYGIAALVVAHQQQQAGRQQREQHQKANIQ